MTKELKLVKGGWYQTRSGEVIRLSNYREGDKRPWASTNNFFWTEDGKRMSSGEECHMDLVRRVNAPTEYVAVKKWKWQIVARENLIDVVITTMDHLEKPPVLLPFYSGKGNVWTKVEGSEVEE